jgi:7-carboxy-7-deazaguanine synthase
VKTAEVYRSFQGEGFLTGTLCTFVRASGCNLRCWFCDTPYTSWTSEGEDLAVEEILDQVARHDTPYVVLTGGEPMLFSELVPLAAALRAQGRHVTIETSGTLDLRVECDLMSISPKFASSAPAAQDHPAWHRRHERSRQRDDVIRRLVADYEHQLKFVLDTPEDCQRVTDYLERFPEIRRSRVLLMPQGTSTTDLKQREGWLLEFCRSQGMGYCPRRQIEWFGLRRGT